MSSGGRSDRGRKRGRLVYLKTGFRIDQTCLFDPYEKQVGGCATIAKKVRHFVCNARD